MANDTGAAARVLVVIATLGRRDDYLDLALRSVADQDVATRVVLVAPDDAVGVRALAERYAAEVLPDPGGGLSLAVNTGIDARSVEDYLVWLGDDDLSEPGGLGALCRTLDDDPAAVVAFGSCRYIDAQGRHLGWSRAGQWALRLLAWGPNLVPQPASMYRLDAVRAAGGFDASLRYAMDLDLFLRLRAHGRLVALPVTTAAFRWHSDSITVAGRAESVGEAGRVRRAHLSPRARSMAALWELPVRWATINAGKLVSRRGRVGPPGPGRQG